MRQKCDQERISEDLTIEIPYSGNTVQVEPKNKSDTSKNRGDWNHFKIIHKIPEQPTGKHKLRNCSKQPYLMLHTNWGKC